MTQTDKPDDIADLAQLLAQGRFQFLSLARIMLDADVPDWRGNDTLGVESQEWPVMELPP